MQPIYRRVLIRYFVQQMLERSVTLPLLQLYEKVPIPTSYHAWKSMAADLIAESNEPWIPAYKNRFQDSGGKIAECAVKHINSLFEAGGFFLPIFDPDYPEVLRNCIDPPLALNVIGPTSKLASHRYRAVVGARKASPVALKNSYEIGRYLSDAGFWVVSGGAIGCDIAAHRGCLSSCRNPMPAVIVFAGGLESYYPKHNMYIFQELKEEGAVFISEKLWGAGAKARDFPVRNRIVAGMSEVVYVMQAGVKSGAMITANKALNYGRDVYVLIHDVDDIRADGSHKLMMEGALGFENCQNLREKSYLGYRVINAI